MKSFNESSNYYISLLVIFILLVQVSSPVFDLGVFAEEEPVQSSFLTLNQSIFKSDDDSKTDIVEIEPGDSITVSLEYSIIVPKGSFENVELTYTIPEGLTFEKINFDSDHIKGGSTGPDGNGKMVFDFTNGGSIAAGLIGSIEIDLKVSNPSTKPNGTEILSDKAIFIGDYSETTGTEKRISNDITLTLTIGGSWEISKTGPNLDVIIPKDINTKYLDVDYTITLNGGNVSLKDVVLEDLIKRLDDNSPVNDIVIENVTGASSYEYKSVENKLTFTIDELLANTSKTINYTVQYPIGDRIPDIVGISEGEYENSISVTGAYFYYDDSDGLIYFRTSSASTSTEFLDSQAYWEVYREETEYNSEKGLYTREIIIPKDPNITTKQQSYTVGVRSVGVGNSDLGEIKLIEQLPSEAIFVPAVDGGTATLDGGLYDSENHTVTWVLTDVKEGDNPTRTVTVEYTIDRNSSSDENEVWVGKTGVINTIVYDTTENTTANAEIRLTKDKVETEFVESTEYWYITKSASPGTFYLENEDKDSPETDYIEYTVKLLASNGGINNLDIDNITIVDELPDFVHYSSIDFPTGYPSGDVSEENKTITWNLSNIPATEGKTLKFRLKYLRDTTDDGNDIGVTPSTNLTNKVTAKDVTPGKLFKDGSEYVDTGTATRTTMFRAPNKPIPTFDLSIEGYNEYSNNTLTGDKHFDRGEYVNYKIKFSNPSDYYEMEEVVIEDEDLPSLNVIDYESIDLGASFSNGNVTLDFKTNSGWIEDYVVTKSVISVQDDLGINNVDGHLEGIRIKYNKIPKGFALSDNDSIKLIGKINDNAGHGDLITNSASLNFKYWHYYYTELQNGDEKTDSVAYRVLLHTPWISALNKTKLTGDSNTEHNPSSIIEFKIIVENDGSLGTGPFIKPVIIDVVPEGFEYVDDSANIKITKISDSETVVILDPPVFDEKINYDGDGKTLLTWSWDDDLEKDRKIELEYKLKIKDTALGGSHTNKLYLSSGAAVQGDFWGKFNIDYILNSLNTSLPSLKSDIGDGDIDKNVSTEQYFEGEHAEIIVEEIDAFTITKWVKGSLDNDFSKDPMVGNATPGGSVDYKIKIENEGNVYGSWIEVMDILPYVGDRAVLVDVPRDSQWRPYFLIKEDMIGSSTNPTKWGTDIQLGTDEFDNPIIADVEVWFSTAFDPIRYGSGTNDRTNPPGSDTDTTVGTQEPNWFKEILEDETKVQAIKFVISNFENGKGLEPGGEINLQWNMKTPVVDEENINDITYDKATWNTGSVFVEKNNINNFKRMLPITEAPRAGIQLKKLEEEQPHSGEIGNFVWFDKNNNGTQDDGYDGERAGINGIKVKLYEVELDGNGDIINETFIDETRTGPEYSDSESDKGVGDPGYYSFPGLTLDKNYYVEFYIPAYYDVTEKGSGNEQDSDAKEIELNDDGYRVAKTEVFELSSDDKIRHDIDLGLIPAEEGKAELILTKKAISFRSLLGTDISFDDPNAPTNPVNVGETITYKITVQNTGTVPLHNIKLEDVMTNNNIEFDIVEDLNVSVAGNIVTIKELPSVGKYEFNARYTVVDNDKTTNPIMNTIKVWANELKDKDNPDDPYKEVKVPIKIAALRLEKTISELKKKDTDSFVAVSSDEDFGVEIGDTVKYKIVAYNEGSVDLHNVVLKDEMLKLDHSIPSIEKGGNTVVEGESIDYNTEYTVTGSESDPFTNTATATHSDIRYEVKDEVNVSFKGLDVKKEVAKINGEKPTIENGKLKGDKIVTNIGDEIEYTITLTNTDDAPLKNVIITKDILTSSKGEQNMLSSVIDDNPAVKNLNKGESKTFTLIYKVSEADISSTGATKAIKNYVLGKSTYTSEKPAESEDVNIAHLEIEKKADKTTYYVGNTVEYTIKVTNKGSIDLQGITVKDVMNESTRLDRAISSLAVDESKEFKLTYIVTEEDLVKGRIENIATTDSDETEEISDTCTVTVRRKSSGGSGGGGGGGSDEDEDKEPEPKPELDLKPEPQPDPQPVPEPEPQPDPQPEPEPSETTQEPEETGEIIKDEDDVPTYVPPKDKEVIEIVDQPEHGTVKKDDDGNVKYVPNDGYKGPDKFKVKVKDEEGNELILEIEIPDEEIPQGTIKVLPQTGEGRHYPYYLFGLAILLLGLFINLQGFVKKFKH